MQAGLTGQPRCACRPAAAQDFQSTRVRCRIRQASRACSCSCSRPPCRRDGPAANSFDTVDRQGVCPRNAQRAIPWESVGATFTRPSTAHARQRGSAGHATAAVRIWPAPSASHLGGYNVGRDPHGTSATRIASVDAVHAGAHVNAMGATRWERPNWSHPPAPRCKSPEFERSLTPPTSRVAIERRDRLAGPLVLPGRRGGSSHAVEFSCPWGREGRGSILVAVHAAKPSSCTPSFGQAVIGQRNP
ncbi:hypothetical protein L1887_54667 [Cichorium endivia]|nr:hypothetical protein L1887_54667 [Cichorium endivia]